MDTPINGRQNTQQIFLIIVFIAAPLGLVLWLAPGSLAFGDFDSNDIIRLITSLFLVALFMERALEVFITTWRGPTTDRLDHSIAKANEQIAEVKPNVPEALAKELKDLESRRLDYKAGTKRLALWTALAMGLIISGVGVRTLNLLVDTEALGALPRTQAQLFTWVDVMLTGSMIAGGSEAMHKLLKAYTAFMDSTTRLFQARGSGNGGG